MAIKSILQPTKGYLESFHQVHQEMEYVWKVILEEAPPSLLKVVQHEYGKFQNWMKDNRVATFFNKNMRLNTSSIVEVKKYLSLQALELAA